MKRVTIKIMPVRTFLPARSADGRSYPRARAASIEIIVPTVWQVCIWTTSLETGNPTAAA